MRSVRPGMFETNSSSCHCLVICTQEEWQKFIAGELFASGAEYKGSCREELISIDAIYRLVEANFNEDFGFFWQDKTMPPFELVEWVYKAFSEEMLIPGDNPAYDGMNLRNSSDPWWMEHLPESLKPFIEEHPKVLDGLTDWIELEHTPFSYEMIRLRSHDFTMEYDEYESVPPHVVDDARKLCVCCSIDVPLPVVECRAIWYA